MDIILLENVEKLGFKLESSYKIESDSKKIYKNVKR